MVIFEILYGGFTDLRRALADEKTSPRFCYLRWRMRIREEILDKAPSSSIPEEVSKLLFRTSPDENTWRDEFSRLVELVYNGYTLYPPSEDSSTDTDSETDWGSPRRGEK